MNLLFFQLVEVMELAINKVRNLKSFEILYLKPAIVFGFEIFAI